MKRLLVALLLSAITVTSISGCAFNPADTASNITVSPEIARISFSWWGNDKRHEYTMNGVDSFVSKNPNIAVSCHYGVWNGFEKRNRVSMESNNEADVMQINYAWLDQFSNDGDGYYNLYDLAEYIDLTQFSEEDLQFGIKNGKLNALPIAFNTPELFYNNDIWLKYNLPYPTEWEDFINAAKVMSKDGIYPLGMVKKHAFMFVIAWYEQTYGKKIINNDGTLAASHEEFCTIVEFYKTLVTNKVLMPIDEFDRSKFADGTVATTMCWVSDASDYCTALEKKGGHPIVAGIFIAPDAKQSGWYIKPATMYAISNETSNPEAAGKLLNYLINSPEFNTLQLTEKGVPISKSALEAVKSVENGLDSYEGIANELMLSNRDKMNLINPLLENDNLIGSFKSYGDDYIYKKISLRDCGYALEKLTLELQ